MSLIDRFRDAGRAFLQKEERSEGVTSPFPGWMNQLGLSSPLNANEALKQYGENNWLYSAINRVAFQFAETEFKLQRKTAGGIQLIDSHQALTTLNRPQPVQGGKSILTNMDLLIVAAQHLMLVGEGFWLLDKRLKVNGAPTHIVPLLPGYMEVKQKDGAEMLEYIYRLPTKQVKLDPVDVVHFKIPDPNNWVRGKSPTDSIRYALNTNSEADRMNFKRLQNGAVPAGTLSSEQSLSEEDMKMIRKQWQQMYGGSKNSGKTALLPKGLQFNRIQESNQDMQFTEGKEMARDEILANYGVGMEILGRTEAQTRANAEAAIFVFMKFGIKPLLSKFADTLNNEYLPAFPGVENMEFTFDDPVPENMEEKRLNSQTLFDNGALTPDEMREMFGFEPLGKKGVTDVPYFDFNKMPANSPPPKKAA